MEKDSKNLSFGVSTHWQYFNIVEQNYKEYLTNPASVRLAINFSLTAWHLTEWLFHGLLKYNSFNEDFKNLTAFRKHLKQRCPELQYIRDIADGSKHVTLDRHPSFIKNSKSKKPFHHIRFGLSNTRFSFLEIELKNGDTILFRKVVENVMLFWKDYLPTTIFYSIDIPDNWFKPQGLNPGASGTPNPHSR